MICLTVPFAEKDAAKAAGARWDVANKCWYAPDKVAPKLTSQWLPNSEITVCQRMFAVESAERCRKCGVVVPVATLATAGWCQEDWLEKGFLSTTLILSDVIMLPDHLWRWMTAKYPHWGFAFTKTKGYWYFGNRCAACNVALGEFFMFNEPGGAFCPESFEAVSGLSFFPIADLSSCEVIAGGVSHEWTIPGI